LPQVERADKNVEVILRDIDTDKVLGHRESSRARVRVEIDRTNDFPVPAGECESRSGDYSNSGKSRSEADQDFVTDS
jgi:hypothetical protein